MNNPAERIPAEHTPVEVLAECIPAEYTPAEVPAANNQAEHIPAEVLAEHTPAVAAFAASAVNNRAGKAESSAAAFAAGTAVRPVSPAAEAFAAVGTAVRPASPAAEVFAVGTEHPAAAFAAEIAVRPVAAPVERPAADMLPAESCFAAYPAAVAAAEVLGVSCVSSYPW